jgi:taurine dioxygenase
MAEPPCGAVLYGVNVPPYGGDTLFPNQYLAYETLSDGMKALVSRLTAVHSDITVAGPQAARNKYRTNKVREDSNWRETVSEHPVVRTHPETGRKALYVNVGHTVRFKGWTEAESAPLLNFLFQHQIQAEFTCRFNWRVGSMALWDNRCAQHYPVNDYHGHRRVMHRITLAGDTPR